MYNTLSDKNIISELLAWYSIKDIAKKSNISEKIITSALAENFLHFSDIISYKLRTFFSSHIIKQSEKITVHNLKIYIEDGKNILVNSPDGFQTISKFFNKKPRNILKIETINHKIKCSEDHLLETQEGWNAANNLSIGSLILTKSGIEPIISNNFINNEEVFDFTIDHENHRYWGGTGISSHNSGKSYIICNIIQQAQKLGTICLVLDSENALDPRFMSRAGIDVNNEDTLTYAQVVTIQDVTAVISEYLTGYEKEYGRFNKEAPKLMIVLDSLGNCLTDAENEKFEKGVQTGDQGQSAKNKKHLLRTLVSRLGRCNATFVFTDQVYPQDPMAGDGLWAVTNGVKYSASQIALLTKLKLKDATEIVGIKMRVEAYKSRFVKPGTKIELEIPFLTGLSTLTGLLDSGKDVGILEADGIIVKDGHGFLVELDGKQMKFKKSDFTEELLLKILTTNPIAIEIENQFNELEATELFLPEQDPKFGSLVDTDTGEVLPVNLVIEE